MNFWVIFLTGLTVGGLTCLAVQGGLLASVIASREDEARKDARRHAITATAAFLIFKLIGYTALGFLLGAFGGALNISDNMQTIMQLIAGLYMLAVAGNLLNIHPIFTHEFQRDRLSFFDPDVIRLISTRCYIDNRRLRSGHFAIILLLEFRLRTGLKSLGNGLRI